MRAPTHYLIKYRLNGIERSFYLYASAMSSAKAWHMTAVDAGFAEIPKYRCDKVPDVSKPKAEKYGISDVEWLPA